MTQASPRREASITHHVVLWGLLLLVPVAKTTQLLVDRPKVADWQRQLGLAAVLTLATVWLIATAEPVAGMDRRRRWFLAVGLWPDPPLADDGRWRQGRWALAATGIVVAMATTLPHVDAVLRWLGAGIAAACVVALTIVEALRHRRWTRDPTAITAPDRHILWTSAPLTLACIATAIALAVRDRPGSQGYGELAELALVTALGEEFLYRGCLLAFAYRVLRPGAAHVMTALSFGAWHVGNAWKGSRGEVVGSRISQVVFIVLFTFVGGLLFAFLRRRSHSLAGSVLGHLATNLPGRALG